jgi:hypothetical protein
MSDCASVPQYDHESKLCNNNESLKFINFSVDQDLVYGEVVKDVDNFQVIEHVSKLHGSTLASASFVTLYQEL